LIKKCKKINYSSCDISKNPDADVNITMFLFPILAGGRELDKPCLSAIFPYLSIKTSPEKLRDEVPGEQ
jgi:hypothetical protein